MANRSSSKTSRGLLGGVLVAAAAALIAWLSNCIPGFGLGTTPSGEPVTASPDRSPPIVDAEHPGGPRANVSVHGTQCQFGDAAAGPCEAVCATIRAQFPLDAAIEVEATRGSQGAVQALQECLSNHGFHAIHVRSE